MRAESIVRAWRAIEGGRWPLKLTVRPMSNPVPRGVRFKRVLVMALCAVALILGYGFIYMTGRYQTSSPRTPQAASGHTIAYRSKGVTLYLDASESRTLDYLGWGSVLLFLSGGLLGHFWRVPPKGPLDQLPKDVRDRILNAPPSDYEKIRRTYEEIPKGPKGPN
jgi:hypothetical protein